MESSFFFHEICQILPTLPDFQTLTTLNEIDLYRKRRILLEKKNQYCTFIPYRV